MLRVKGSGVATFWFWLCWSISSSQLASPRVLAAGFLRARAPFEWPHDGRFRAG